jgi:ribosomal protein S27AE
VPDISKRDIFSNIDTQAGKRAWRRSGQQGRLAKSSFNAEKNAPRTWILYADPHGAERCTIECELYTVGRQSDASEAVVMLHGMCPKCGETFIAREDNKTMSLDKVTFRQAPKFLRVNWAWHCEKVLGRRPRDSDKILVVSSPERWACDYCHEWCVKVSGGVAKDDHRGAAIISLPSRPKVIDRSEAPTKGLVEF